MFCSVKKVMTKAVVEMLEKKADLSNSNPIRSANGLLSKKRTSDNSIGWIGRTKNRLLDNKFKISY